MYCVCLCDCDGVFAIFACVLHNIAYIKWIIFISCSRQSSVNEMYLTIVRFIYKCTHWLKFTETVRSLDIARCDHLYMCAVQNWFVHIKQSTNHAPDTDGWTNEMIGEVDHGEGDALHLNRSLTLSLASMHCNRALKAEMLWLFSPTAKEEKKTRNRNGLILRAVQMHFSGKSKHLIRKINLIRLDWHFAIDRLIYTLLSNDFDPFSVINFSQTYTVWFNNCANFRRNAIQNRGVCLFDACGIENALNLSLE